MDRAGFQRWLDRYIEAWKSYDGQQIGDLFSEDAVYRYHPQDDGERGRAEIVAAWLHEPDQEGQYDAQYEPLAIDGDIHVARGRTRYFDANGDVRDEFFNIFVSRFDPDGRCTEFTEYWIQNRDFRRRDQDEMKRQGSSAG